jgi:hypothetical protein
MVLASLVNNRNNELKIPPFFYIVSCVGNLYADVPEPLRLRILCGICLSRRHIAREIKTFWGTLDKKFVFFLRYPPLERRSSPKYRYIPLASIVHEGS